MENAANLGQAAPPWMLWGQTKRLRVPPTPLIAPVSQVTDTVARAGYGRPETWHWMFHAVIVGGGTATAVGESAFVEISFELISGLGRSAIVFPDFELMQWDWSGGAIPFVGQPVYSNTAFGRRLIGGVAPPIAEVPLLEQFVSQDITIRAKAAYFTDVVGAVAVELDVTAQICPAHHTRPDWYQVDAPPTQQFPGGETGGR